MNPEYTSLKITTEHAGHIAHELYGVDGVIKALPGELDFNFRIETQAKTFVLKVSRPDVDMDYLRYQQELLKYISSSNLKITSPVPIPDLKGNQLSETKDDAGRKRLVRLLSWVEGRLWSEVNPIRQPLLNSLGEQAGGLSHALQGFKHPRAHRAFDWDLAQAAWTSRFIHLFSGEQQQIVQFFQEPYYAFQDKYGQLRKSVVQNDANDNNVIVSHNLVDPTVNAIIDFGDAIHTQVINDLAIAIACFHCWKKSWNSSISWWACDW